jgi:hypothetical protein
MLAEKGFTKLSDQFYEECIDTHGPGLLAGFVA